MRKDIKTINDLINTSENPGQGLEIPWNDPDFSRRILKDQLDPDSDITSRRPGAITKQVEFIHHQLLQGQQTYILDLACGPGLHSYKLAKLGHRCQGIDIAPAAIEHARSSCTSENLNCNFLRADLFRSDYGRDYGLAMLTFGDFNSYPRNMGDAFIHKVFKSIKSNGLFLLEVLNSEGIRNIGEREPGWLSVESGIFSDRPYLFLDKYTYDKSNQTSVAHYFIIDIAGRITHYQQIYNGYSDDDYQNLLLKAGFDSVEFYPNFAPGSHDFADDLQMIVARK